MINVYFNGNLISENNSIKIPKIRVDRTKDNDPKNPLPTIFEMKMENKGNHIYKDLQFVTNLPTDTYDLANFPTEINRNSFEVFNFYFYASRALDSKNFPESIFMNIKGNEVLVSS